MIKTETKVKAAAWATFLAATAGLTVLQTTVTDMVPVLPDWLETPAYALLLTAATWLAGYATRTRPAGVSDSTVDAVGKWTQDRRSSHVTTR